MDAVVYPDDELSDSIRTIINRSEKATITVAPPAELSEYNYYCNTCGFRVVSVGLPEQWVRIQMCVRQGQTKLTNLGMYCSRVCVAMAMLKGMQRWPHKSNE